MVAICVAKKRLKVKMCCCSSRRAEDMMVEAEDNASTSTLVRKQAQREGQLVPPESCTPQYFYKQSFFISPPLDASGSGR